VADGICNNCGTRLVGPYCHACGQKEVDDEWRSIGAIARQLWSEIASFDFKSARSLGALLRPGFLSAEFIAGRRARYLGPIKVYFLCAAVFFVLAPLVAGFTFEGQIARDPDGRFRAMADARMAATGMPRQLFAEHYNSNAKTVYTLSPILSVLAFTLLLRVVFRRRFDRLGPHVVVAVHYVAFFYLAALATGAVAQALHPNNWLLLAAMQAIMGCYLFGALRRVYRETTGVTLAKAAVLLLLAFVIDSPINIAARTLIIGLT